MPATAETAWAPGPLRPLLAAGAVHVWRADLSDVGETLGELLCDDERERAERFLNHGDGQLWQRSRGLLRALLGRYLQREPASLRFATGEHGKPQLMGDASSQLAFNMSHSGELALYAFSDAGAVGVDVEVARRPVEEVAIAARALGAAEANRLQALDPSVRGREFLRAWTRHEAELKCLGVGIGGALADVADRGLSVVELELGGDAAAALASDRTAAEVRCWDWQASESR